MNRRHFLRRTAAATAGLALALPRRSAAQTSANETVNVAIIGLRGDNKGHATWTARGRGQDHYEHLSGIPNVRITPCRGRRRTSFQRLAVRREAEVRGESEDGDRFPPRARRQGRRCGDHRRSRSLARAHDDLGLPGGKGRLRRKAHQPQHRRRPKDDRGRAAVRPHRRGRNPEAQQRRACQGGPVPSRRRAGHRLCGQDRRLPAENSYRSRCRQRRAAGRELRSVARTGACPVRSTRTISTITGTGSGSTARPISATRASTPWTPSDGCWENRNIRVTAHCSWRPVRGGRPDGSDDAEYAVGHVSICRRDRAPLRPAQLVQRSDPRLRACTSSAARAG